MEKIASRIKMARVMSGLSMQDLANKTNNTITKQAISKYEKELMKPSEVSLLAISRALGLRMDYFLRESILDLGNIKYRKQTRLPKKMQDAISEKTRDFLERYIEAESLLGFDSEGDYTAEKSKIDSKEEAEEVAQKIRNEWNLGLNPIYNIQEMLEGRGFKIVNIAQEIKHFSGMSTWIEGNIPVIVLSTMPIDRTRFTTLHELGHLILEIEHLDEKLQERICDRFAGAMLIPADSLKKELGEHRKHIPLGELKLIKAEYGISPQALLYRAKDIGIISESYFADKARFYRMRGIWNVELGEYKGEEKSNRLLQLLLRGISEGFITSVKAASLYNMKLVEFRQVIKDLNEGSHN